MRFNPVFRTLSEIARDCDASVGGKAYNLALLQQAGLSVPEGIALNAPPESDSDWAGILAWWESIGNVPLAARSSALGEDAKDTSFAGQLTSVLEIGTEEELRSAIATCFASRDRDASRAYREHFNRELKGMNVLVQRMVDPLYSGVYFSSDPRRSNASWLIEVVDGLGEKLVSGQVTPHQFSEGRSPGQVPEGWKPEFTDAIAGAGEKVKAVLGFDVDMEWAIDRGGGFWVLQARPITTLGGAAGQNDVISAELERLQSSHEASTLWDGQTFVEWTGLPSPLSFSIWEKAFSIEGAFPRALQEMGYVGSDSRSLTPQERSLLERVFGRACLNLNRLQPLFFGKIPYTMEAEPHPHLDFSWKKIDAPTIFHAPAAIARMMKVAWNMQTHKSAWLRRCHGQLEELRGAARDLPPDPVSPGHADDLIERFDKEALRFACEDLKWSFVLAILAESTEGTLELTLAKDVGEEKAKALLRGWMSRGLATATAKMERAYQAACADPALRTEFLSAFGHRGPGELDLAHPRWRELGDRAFSGGSGHDANKTAEVSIQRDIDENVHAIRRPLVEQEWARLKEILELREELKMEVMRRYAELRRLALAIDEKMSLGNNIFYLTMDEIRALAHEPLSQDWESKIAERRREEKAFAKIALPVSFALSQLEEFLSGDVAVPGAEAMSGEPLSSGVAHGEVRIVRNPEEAMASPWPENAILVAEATDPGWTPLFHRARGIIVERGGVLSHCAIVAREMGLPAVSRINGCTRLLKDGDHVWVDGNTGRVTIASEPAASH